uniref:Uncharacterized protein n=1 Tax=Tanacetum cinerariifolium TaxID=118510 RepID=A0A699H9J2_TANCI|nr:hypothetical protein [Tanacetum cinerariifolium]
MLWVSIPSSTVYRGADVRWRLLAAGVTLLELGSAADFGFFGLVGFASDAGFVFDEGLLPACITQGANEDGSLQKYNMRKLSPEHGQRPLYWR